jgi:hypothetical protein
MSEARRRSRLRVGLAPLIGGTSPGSARNAWAKRPSKRPAAGNRHASITLGAQSDRDFVGSFVQRVFGNGRLSCRVDDDLDDHDRGGTEALSGSQGGYSAADSLYRVRRPVLVDLRLHDILHDALCLWLLGRFDARGSGSQCKPVSDRLVRGKSADADSDYPHHSHQQDSFFAKPCILAIDGDVRHRCGDWCWPAVLAPWSLPRFHSLAFAILAATSSHGSGIWALDPLREDLAAAKKLDLIVTIAGLVATIIPEEPVKQNLANKLFDKC